VQQAPRKTGPLDKLLATARAFGLELTLPVCTYADKEVPCLERPRGLFFCLLRIPFLSMELG
jgi:hypothetical protein